MSDQPTHIFPTLHKDKHSKLVAFPLGAQALSRLLEGVPQHDLLTCGFTAGDHADREKTIVSVLMLMYRKSAQQFASSKHDVDRGAFDSQWLITVFAVPTELRHEIKSALIESRTVGSETVESELEKTVRPWLLEQFAIHGKTGECTLILRYDRFQKTFSQSTQKSIQLDRA